MDNATVALTRPSCAQFCVQVDVSKAMVERFWIEVSETWGFW